MTPMAIGLGVFFCMGVIMMMLIMHGILTGGMVLVMDMWMMGER